MNAESSQVKIAPFRAVRDAYAGPQQLALAGGIRRALIAPDSVVTLSGPVGTGKTASVRHALSRIGQTVVIARIGRVHLQRDDVLEVLLDEFGMRQKPVSALQRFSAMKRLLTNWAEVGTDVFVVVEDGERLGVEALTELESLTAADDDTPGAHLILMGTETLGQFLRHPALARLKQRVRRNLALEPFSLEETRGYLSHCLSVAGKDLADIFADDAVDIVHRCSGGVARVINNVAETMMIVAADTGSGRITGALARNIAVEDFEFETTEPVKTPTEPGRISRRSDDPASENLPQLARDNFPAGGAPGASASADRQTPSTAATGTQPTAAEAESDIPDLIQDTLPPMPALSDTDLEAANQAVERAASGPGLAAGEAHQLLDELIPKRPTDAGMPPAMDSGAGKLRLEPRIPERLSKSTDTADTQTMKALDSALRPDTQLLRSLEEPVEPVVDDAPVPLGLRKEITDDRSRSPEAETTSIPTLAAIADPEDDDLPTLSNSMRFDVAEDASADAVTPPAGSDIGAGKNRVDEADTAPDQGAPASSVQNTGDVTEPEPSPAVTPGGKATADAQETPRPPVADTSSSGAATLTAYPPQATADPVAGPRIDEDPDRGSKPLPVDSVPATKAGGESDTLAASERVTPEPGIDDPARADDDVEDEACAEGQRPVIGTAGSNEADKPALMSGGDWPALADADTDASDAAPESKLDAHSAGPTRDAVSLKLEETPDNELPEISLVPEITLDKSLDDHQKAAQARLAKEAERCAAASATTESRESAEGTAAVGKSDSAPEQAEMDADADDEAERKQRLESLTARFGSARSIEDVLDDTAAETLFGEEFSQIAAAVTAMHESQSSGWETPDHEDDGAEPPVTLSLEEVGEAGPGATAASTPGTAGDARTQEPASKAVPPGPAGGNGAGTSANSKAAKTPASAATDAPGVPTAATGSPGNPPRPPSTPKDTKLDSSAAQRLEMVRALNKKAGKAMPPMPDSAGEEIVLGGDDSSPTCNGPKPERIENQFGLSMTATLKALSAENIKSMQEEEEAEKKEKKKGLLSRFRRS